MENYWMLHVIILKVMVPCPFAQLRQGHIMADKVGVYMASSTLLRGEYLKKIPEGAGGQVSASIMCLFFKELSTYDNDLCVGY